MIPINPNRNISRPTLLVLCLVLGLLSLKYLLPLILPVVLGFLLAAILSPLILRIQSAFHLRRSTASVAGVSGVLVILSVSIWLFGRLVLQELSLFYQQLPVLLSAATDYVSRFGQWAQQFSAQLPGDIGEAFGSWASDILSSGGTIASSLSQRLFTFVSGFLSSLPDHLLFLLTLILSCYFSAAELPRFRELLEQHLTPQRRDQLRSMLSSIRTVLGGWFRAQVKLMGITFLILLTGLLILGVHTPLFLALGIALLDALPLFGTGTVLIPWSLCAMASGKFHFGIGLLVIYGIAALSRNVLEPRFLGAQTGTSPLLTLLAIYTGYRLSGLTGMLFLPIVVMVASELAQAHRLSQGQI